MRALVAISILSFALCLAVSATARASAPDTDRVAIEYVAPRNAQHAELAASLRERRVLEELQAYLGPFRLPVTLTLKLASCDGANAWYEERVITVCYEYLADLVAEAPTRPTPFGITRADAIVGPTMEVFLHEVAHGLFDVLGIPVLGREEDAADQIAAYLLLNLSKAEARRAVAGTAYMYLREANAFTPALKHFAGAHGVPAQRYYNLLCLAYGADPVLFSDAVQKKLLPAERAEDCESEYEQVRHAFRTLIAPHVDGARLRQARSRPWLTFDDAAHVPPARAKTR